MPDLHSTATTFISYSRKDETFALRLYNDLSAAGVRPWLDRYDIPPGAIWDDEIQRGLNAVSHVLVLVSKASVASDNVHAEWNYALSTGKMVIPVILEQMPTEAIPLRLHGPNWVMVAGQDYRTALAKLLAVLPVTAAANPAAAPEPEVAPVDPDPVAAAAAWKRGNAAFNAGDLGAARGAYTESIRLAPDQPEGYIHRGMVAYLQDRYLDALSDFDRAQQLGPDIPLLYNNRGVTYSGLKQYALALADFDEALMLNPDYANALYNRAGVLMTLKRYRLAAEHYTRALKISDRVPAFYNNRGLSYAAMDDLDAAMADYNRAVELDPNYASAYGNRANAYANAGHIEEALADYDRVIALNPEHALAYAGRSEIRFCAGDYAHAVLDASTVIGLRPDFHGGYALRALANFRRGKRDEALADMARAVDLDVAWSTANEASAYLTVCPDDALAALHDLLAARAS
jgi:tetratricopeptide (TPR) repeat protein